MSSIKCLTFKFLQSKIMHKKEKKKKKKERENIQYITKFDMCVKNIKKIYNLTIRFSKYKIMLILSMGVVALSYN